MSDSTELAHRQEGGAIALNGAASVLAMVLDAARDPNIDAAKVETMANLAMKLQDREQQAEFNKALNAAIMEMPVITKDGKIVIADKGGDTRKDRIQGRFAKFEDIDRVVRPILQRHNLAIRFEAGEKDQAVTVRPIISHTNGYTERGEAMRLPLDSSGGKNNTQGSGSSVTYGKRYTMCAALNIVTEGLDDDGRGGLDTVSVPFERQLVVQDDAAKAQEEGRYQEWFNTQSPKDRAWLIQTGEHEKRGGVASPMIEGPKETSRKDPPPAETQPPRVTPESWTEGYEDDCKQAKSLDALSAIKRKADGALAKLLNTDQKLWDRCDAAFDEARTRLTPADGLFGGDK